ncbi:AfsR/SARP family transcriptional regulator [Kutzneria chonburiensis]|uniref:BTAD domain-containing putative transcriptional regulator n=1 Tax=Kutzneria chonburiensis TaxID=1483604 RepID=A0ABV6N7B1_9PSEU|nr:BTAD domain-containing putative transcriptional regulator [Kutzneria chonburiensis]
MRVRLLGPVELTADQHPLDLGGPRQRVALAVLGLNVNRVTSVDHLIDAIWGEAPPPTARAQIQVCISSLRKRFGEAGRPDAIKTRSPGYVLELDSSEVDSLEFGELVAVAQQDAEAGRTAAAAATLRTALGLWRGPALDGVTSDLLRHEATVLNDRRLTVLEERFRLDLLLGRHEEANAELPALIGVHPLRERLYGLLMVALYRSGRQAEALEVFQRARALLVEEIGIEPGPELCELEHAILNRSPALDLAPVDLAAPEPETRVTPRQLPTTIGDFTGRDGLLDEIRRLVGAEAGLAVPIVAISGRGGVGKSALAIHAAHELGQHFPDGHLYVDLHAPESDDRTPALLARFLRALGVPATSVPDGAEERAELYRSRLADKRVLLVLDGVRDEAQVWPLLPGSPTCAVIATSRSRLSGVPGALCLDVGVFSPDGGLELLGRIIGADRVQAEPEAAAELVALCDGLPLALRIAGARLASRAHWRIDGLVRRLRDEQRRLDELSHRGLEIRSNIGLTYQALPSVAQRLFRLFSLVQAPDSPAWVAAALLDVDLATAEDILDALVEAQAMETVQYPDSPHPRYRFHELIRAYAREQLLDVESTVDRDAALARMLGGWMALAEEAHRREYGGDYTVIHGTAARWRLPAEVSAEIIGTPMTWWDSERHALVAAVRQAAEAGMDELCWDLALTSVTLFEAKGYFDDWRETACHALGASSEAGNRTGTAAAQYSLGTLHMFQTRTAEAANCFRAALMLFEAVGNMHGQALVLRNAAHVDGIRGDNEAMLAKYDEALEIMPLVGDRIGEAHIQRSLAGWWLGQGQTTRARGLLEQALSISRQEHCLRVEAQVLHRFAELHVAVERFDLAREALHRVLRIVRNIGDQIGEAYAVYGLGVVRQREGRLDAAATTMAHALDLSRRLGERLVEARSRYALGEIALLRADFMLASTHLQAARTLFAALGSTVWLDRTLGLLDEVEVGVPS